MLDNAYFVDRSCLFLRMTWQTDLLPDADESHKMEMTGDAVSIFRREFFFGVVSGVEGECPLNGTSKLRPSDAIFEVSFPKDEFDTQELCTAAVVPEYAGFKLKYHKNDFKLSFDIQSAMVALGVSDLFQHHKIKSNEIV